MLFKKKKNFITRKYGVKLKRINFKRIMFVSCYQISFNSYKIRYLIDYKVNSSCYDGLISNDFVIDFKTYNSYFKKYSYGVWYKNINFLPKDFYYYIYSNSDNLIYKTTKNNNGLKIGNYNSYNHELQYKAYIQANSIVENVLY